MIDLCRKSILSQLGKDAGNQSISDYTRNIITNYNGYLIRIKEEKQKISNN